MKYLLDTNHWSYFQQKHPVLLKRIDSLPVSAKLFISVVTQGELLAGIECRAPGRRKTQLLSLYEREIQRAAGVLPIDTDVAHRFASVFAQLRRVGRPIGSNDMWIAATALSLDLTVVSNDAHFRFIDGLRVEDWTQG